MNTPAYPSDVVFTPTVKALQEARGSRHAYARVEQRGGWPSRLAVAMNSVVCASMKPRTSSVMPVWKPRPCSMRAYA